MGFIYIGECKCGYESDEIYEGCSAVSDTVCDTFPFYCIECNELVVIDVSKKDICCPICNSETIIPYDDKIVCKTKNEIIYSIDINSEIGKDFKLSKYNNFCPKCRQYTLEFKIYGSWS